MGGYEWLIGTRYLRSTHRRGFVSFVALISVCGLTLGVATLIVVLSVMNGFERERAAVFSRSPRTPPSWVSPARSPTGATCSNRCDARAVCRPAVPYVESLCVLANGRRLAGASVRGVLPQEERAASGLARHVISGSLDELKAGAYGTILGSALAHELNARVGDSVVLIAPRGHGDAHRGSAAHAALPRGGLFQSGMYEFDRGLALVPHGGRRAAVSARRSGDRPAAGVR